MSKKGYFTLGILLLVLAFGAIGTMIVLTSAPESPTGEAFRFFPKFRFPRIPVRICGNGLVEAGEQCEPPNTATCNATCQKIVAACVDTDKSIDYGMGMPSTASPDASQKYPDLFVRGNATAPAIAPQNQPQITGEDPNRCGKRTLPSTAGYAVFIDCCVDSASSKILSESFCKGPNGPYSLGIECANGCKDGACVPYVPTGSFKLASVSPSYHAVMPGNSVQTNIILSSVDGFSGIVSLAAACPAGATCTFAPSGTSSIPAGGSVSVNLAISTSQSIPVGNYNITVTASSAGLPSTSGTAKLSIYTNTSQLCGNGEYDPVIGGYVAEQCDAGIISRTCASYLGSSFTGDLSCTARCMFNTSGCTYVTEPPQPVSPPANPSIGEQKTLVILADFEENPLENYTASDVPIAQEYIFTKLDTWLRQNSYGKMWLSGTVVGPYKIAPGVCDQPDYGEIKNQMRMRAITAADPDVDYRQYSRIILLSDTPGCVPIGGGAAPVTANTQEGTITFLSVTEAWYKWFTDGLGIGLVAHELGHSLGYQSGIGHPSIISCTLAGNPGLLSDSCTEQGPGDPYTIMGGAERTQPFNSIERRNMGWLPDNEILTANKGTFSLIPLESSAAGYKSIRVPVPNSEFEYYIEFRQPGYEQFIYPATSTIPFATGFLRQLNGVAIHAAKQGAYPFTTNYLMAADLNMNDPDGWTGLQVGKTYTDKYGTSITINSIINNVASITIDSASGITQCNDGINNDPISDEISEKFKDSTDFSCIENGVYNPNHLSEFEPLAACQDRIDNDNDGAVDTADSGCSGTQDNSE